MGRYGGKKGLHSAPAIMGLMAKGSMGRYLGVIGVLIPLGVSFYGRAWSEPVLLRLAYAFEQATKARRAPTFTPTLSLS